MIYWEGEETYLSNLESDPSTGYRVHLGARAGQVAFWLLSADDEGKPLVRP